MSIVYYILCFISMILLVPVSVLLTQVVAATFLKENTIQVRSKEKRPSIVVLMPAHNEALVIEQCIQSIKRQLLPEDTLLVVADNCNDDTAAIAEKLGADVIKRHDEQNRGKGFALDYGLRHINNNPPDVVVVVDADCIIQEKALDRLVRTCDNSQRPIQALYLMESQAEPSLKARIAEFAWVVKNKVRPLGFKAMGLPCQLMGTGMAFLWGDIKKVDLASGHIVEDMKLGTDLAQLNKAPMFLKSAVVTSIFPPSDAATNTQRARWEHGHLSVILTETPKLLYQALKNRNFKALGMAFDLLVPPLALLSLVCVVNFVVNVLFGSSVSIILSACLLGLLALSIFLAWVKFGRMIISFKQLCYAPIYALSKIPLYLKFFLNRQVEWVRSKRD